MIDKLLKDNNLERKILPYGSNSLLRAISDALYFTSEQSILISSMLVSYLKKQIEINLLPPSLSILMTNQALQDDYCKQPFSSGFDSINLQLISMMFRVKINLYFIQDNRLSCRIFNNQHIRMIEICKDENNHYDSVYSKDFIQDATFVQQILYQIINQISGNQEEIPKLFKNIEMELWLNEKLIPDLKLNKLNRSNSQHSKEYLDPLQLEIEIIKKQQQENDTQINQIQNLKNNPPGLGNNNNKVTNNNETPNKKPLILEVPEVRQIGRLKFFDEQKCYGFIVLDSDNSDVFVHLDDLQKAGITKDDLRKLGSCFRSQTQVNHYGRGTDKPPLFSFQLMTYLGKYDKSRKAVDLKLINE